MRYDVDPHAPLKVRQPYDTMFANMTFDVPPTARAALERNPALPIWADQISVPLEDVNATLTNMEKNKPRQRRLQNIFGMIALIDDKVGELLKVLENKGVVNNTIVVFTSGMCCYLAILQCFFLLSYSVFTRGNWLFYWCDSLDQKTMGE